MDRHSYPGQVDRGTGVLNNELYIGRLVWNRCSYIRDPSTGRRLARLNPTDEGEQTEVRTEMGRDDNRVALNRAHGAQHLLSRLLFCRACGSPFAMRYAQNYGCSNYRLKATCTNAMKINRADVERLIGDAIRHRWMNETAMARLRTEAIAERKKIIG